MKSDANSSLYLDEVTPHAGVRIEMFVQLITPSGLTSPPTRGCELKLCEDAVLACKRVTPHAGVRIEIRCRLGFLFPLRHPPRGGAN